MKCITRSFHGSLNRVFGGFRKYYPMFCAYSWYERLQKAYDISLTVFVTLLYLRWMWLKIEWGYIMDATIFLYISCKEFLVFSMYEQWSGYVFFCIISTFHLPCTSKYDKYFDVSHTAFTIICIYAKIHTHTHAHTYKHILYTKVLHLM